MNHKHNISLTKNELKNIISKQDRENVKLRERIRQLEAQLHIYENYKKRVCKWLDNFGQMLDKRG